MFIKISLGMLSVYKTIDKCKKIGYRKDYLIILRFEFGVLTVQYINCEVMR